VSRIQGLEYSFGLEVERRKARGVPLRMKGLGCRVWEGSRQDLGCRVQRVVGECPGVFLRLRVRGVG